MCTEELREPYMRLHRIELPTPFPVGSVNAYLLAGDPLTLVDAGPKTQEAQRALEAGVASAGFRIESIRRILLTHGHVDHSGNAAWLAQRTGAVVYLHAADRGKVGGRRWVASHVKIFFTQADFPGDSFMSFPAQRHWVNHFPTRSPAPLRWRMASTCRS